MAEKKISLWKRIVGYSAFGSSLSFGSIFSPLSVFET